MKKNNGNLLGKSNGRSIYSNDHSRKEHVHIIGGTGSGKSVFLTNQIIQDIEQGRGLCLIDPHGSLYDDIFNWLALNPTYTHTRKIHLADFTEPQLGLSYNPIKYSGGDPTVIASNCTKAISTAWKEDITQTPQLKEVLQNIIHVLTNENMTLLEADLFLSIEHKELRREITNKYPGTFWKNLDALSDRAFLELTASARRRIYEFMENQTLRSVFGQTKANLDFYRCMENKEIVLIKLSPEENRLSDEQSRLLGCLLVNTLLADAKKRNIDKAKTNPYYLYIDEIQNFLTADLQKILTECRKYGLFMNLAHQNLEQLLEVGKGLFTAVMGSAQTKCIFGELDYDEAMILARNTYKKINLKEIKHVQKSPTVIGHRREWFGSKSISEAESVGKSEGISEAEGEGFSEAVGETQGVGHSKAHSAGSSIGSSFASGSASGISSGSSVASSSMTGSGSSITSGQVFNPALEDTESLFFPDTNEAISTTEGLSDTSVSSIGNSESFSNMESHTSSQMNSKMESNNQSSSSAKSNFSAASKSQGKTLSRSKAKSLANSKNQSQGKTSGKSEGLVPIIKEIATNTTFYSLNEQHHRNVEKLRNLGVGEFQYKSRSMTEPIKIKAPYQESKPTWSQIKDAKIRCFRNSDYIQTTKRLLSLIEEREESWKSRYQNYKDSMDDAEFFE